MKILVNTSTIVGGGGLQVSRALLVELSTNSRGHVIKNVVSRELADVLPSSVKVSVVSPSPARLLSGIRSRACLRRIEREFAPDIVLTAFGPSYWRPMTTHICGFADAWVFTSNEYSWKVLDPITRIKTQLKCIGKRLALAHENPRAFIVEIESLGRELESRFTNTGVYVIQNNCGQAFFEQRLPGGLVNNSVMPRKRDGEFRIVTLSKYYSHKCLDIIPRVAGVLNSKMPESRFRFFVSLDDKSEEWGRIADAARELRVQDTVVTVGVVKPEYAPYFYVGADAMFLPSVLECFSANYPEAMKMGIPIVTTDLPFARNVCQAAALYFEPLNELSAAEKIIELYSKDGVRKALISRGHEIVDGFPTPEEKANQYVTICEKVHGESQ